MRQRGPAAKAADEEVRSRARDLLGITDRSESGRDVEVPGLKGKIRLRILSQKQRREAHKAAREWCRANGFNPEAADGTNSYVEFTNAIATQMLIRSCLNPSGLFPLWGDGNGGKVHDDDPDPEEEIAEDLTPEQVKFLEVRRQAFQDDVSPALEDASPELFAEVIRTAKKGGKAETIGQFLQRSPRHVHLSFAHFMDTQLPSLTGWILPTSTSASEPADGSSGGTA